MTNDEQIISAVCVRRDGRKHWAYTKSLSQGELDCGYGPEYRGPQATERATTAQEREAAVYNQEGSGYTFLTVTEEELEAEVERRKEIANKLFVYHAPKAKRYVAFIKEYESGRLAYSQSFETRAGAEAYCEDFENTAYTRFETEIHEVSS